jgi:hypothetical protein
MYKAIAWTAMAGCFLAQPPPSPPQRDSQPIFRVTVIEKSTIAISYQHSCFLMS